MRLFEGVDEYKDIFAHFLKPEAVEGHEGFCAPVDLPAPQAVLFDVYDTLLCSTIGDLEEQRRRKSENLSFVDTALHFGFNHGKGLEWHRLFFEYIYEEHLRCRKLGITQPEVLVERIWDRILKETVTEGSRFDGDARKIGLYRELRANPVAPFKGILDLWSFLIGHRVFVGLVTNAQYYTLPILSWALDVNLMDYLTPEIVICSYALGYSKPDPYFFRYVEIQISLLGLKPHKVWIVGNDPEKDMAPAKSYGFVTVLFNGRSPEIRSAYADATVGSFPGLKKLVENSLREGNRYV